MKRLFLASIAALSFSMISCTDTMENNGADVVLGEVADIVGKGIVGKEYDIEGCTYTSYKGLVMAGYQGWFNCEGDGADRGWNHYQLNGSFAPESCSIDFWPDVSEYEITYETAFPTADGSSYAHVFSSYDESSIDLHFKWMQEHGIDGVYMQRFVSNLLSASGKAHADQVLKYAFAAAKKYNRAISVMYDISENNQDQQDIVDALLEDWPYLVEMLGIDDNVECPTYLREYTKPVVAIWGVGFTSREFTYDQIYQMVDGIKGDDNAYSILLGVPYCWRTLTSDANPDPELHEVIKKCEIIMPWAVGRYNTSTYYSTASETIEYDLSWCRENNILYSPCVFPGFSWRNLKMADDPDVQYDAISRNGGEFLWKQIYGAKITGSSALYVAMFDEVDEGTAIFKCLNQSDVPQNGANSFVGIDDDLETDHYLWLVGKAAEWFHGDATYSNVMPVRE